MRILLDECVPRGVKRFLAGHDVLTVQDLAWSGYRNGRLLTATESERFEVLITCDKNLRYQQRVIGRGLCIVQLPTNDLSQLKTLSNRIRQAVDPAVPGSFVAVDF